jgi:HAD superfamily phosphoserine phosphatase-like hydrolase
MVSAVIFDLDGTLTGTPNPWRHIHECLGVWEGQASTHVEEWLTGKMRYDEFCRKDFGLWRGRSVSELHGYLDKIEMNPHVPEVVTALERRNIPSIIISSGFTYIASKIQRACNWERLLVYANELADGPQVHIRVSADKASGLSKKVHADASLRLVGAEASETLVVSDSTHDLEQLCDCRYQLHVQQTDDLRRTLQYLD